MIVIIFVTQNNFYSFKTVQTFPTVSLDFTRIETIIDRYGPHLMIVMIFVNQNNF